jgi:hypothetical protein
MGKGCGVRQRSLGSGCWSEKPPNAQVPCKFKTGTHIGHDGIPELVKHRDKWAAPGPRCRPVTWRRGDQIWRGPGFRDGKAIYSDRLQFILAPGVCAVCWTPARSVTPQPSMPVPPSIVTLGSILCPQPGRAGGPNPKTGRDGSFPN